MERSSQQRSWGSVCALATALSFVFLGFSLGPSIRPLLAEATASYAIRAVTDTDSLGVPLMTGLALFMLTCFLLHLCVGALAVALTWAAERSGLAVPRERLGVSFLWYVALAAAFVFWSAAHFPQSHAASAYGSVASFVIFGQSLATLWVVGIVLAALAVVCVAAWKARGQIAGHRLVSALAVATVATSALGFVRGDSAAPPGLRQEQPHVIILGIDSLRPDVMQQMAESGSIPNLAALLSKSAWFPDTTTPLARTYPAWVSILTGRAPADSSIVCNLMPRDEVTLTPTLASGLRQHGYRTILATDEVRFSNIDESYGFDQLVTPSIGAAEFLVGRLSDLPVLNAIVNSAAAEWLLPQIHGNRAVAHAYKPETFVRRLRRSVAFGGPTFLAVHLTLPHWPFVFADSPVRELVSEPWSQHYENYIAMVQATDKQLGDIWSWLEAEGALHNAVVVVLSDHGEALYRPGDSLLEGANDAALESLAVSPFGHGSSVLSAAQFQVVLGFSAHGAASGMVSPGPRQNPAALEDVAPTLLDLLGIAQNGPVDGHSLAGEIRRETDDGRMQDRSRFTETGFNTPRLLAGDLNQEWIAMQAADYYRVNPRNGYLELRRSSISVVNAMKERAVIRGDLVLAALPNTSGGQTYVLAHRRGGRAQRVTSLEDHPAVRPMWEAMVERFGEASIQMPMPTGSELLQ